MLYQILAIGAPQIIIVLIVFLFGLLFPLLAIIDIVKNDFEGNNKIVWLLFLGQSSILLWVENRN